MKLRAQRLITGGSFDAELTDYLGDTVALVRYADEAERLQRGLELLDELDTYGYVESDDRKARREACDARIYAEATRLHTAPPTAERANASTMNTLAVKAGYL
jgi:hypothetical protein